ncbi:hypothetical protein MUA24_14595 (plasmid) [Staphylococcus aureus]|nr:hypothetical protein [Staphylococcus aureus]UXV48983.1 hypothetical protein MUA24_14595 [Staphylococcus aureus]
MKNIRLNKYLNDIFGDNFVKQNELNFTRLEDAINEIYKDIDKHKNTEGVSHDSAQISHDSVSLNESLDHINKRLDNQVVGKIGDNAELSDARASIDGKSFDTLGKRLHHDLTNIDKLAKYADKLVKNTKMKLKIQLITMKLLMKVVESLKHHISLFTFLIGINKVILLN